MLYEDIIRRVHARPGRVENVTLGTSASYTTTVFPANTIVRVSVSTADLVYVKLCREYLRDSGFGYGAADLHGPRELFTVDGAGPADDDEFVGDADSWTLTTVTSTHVLERTNALASNGNLEFLQDDASDILSQKIGLKSDDRSNDSQLGLAYGKDYNFFFRHLDSDATKLMTYQVTFYLEGTGLMYWDGSAWTSTATWIDITGSATDATFLDTVTAYAAGDERYPRNYTLNIAAKTDYAAETSIIESIGFCDIQADKEGVLLGYAGAEKYLSAPWPFRVAGDAVANTPVMNVAEMIADKARR